MSMQKHEKGAVIIEATIYFPLVLCTVMALIYLALFNMQEYMLMYEVQRVAAVASREEAYLGYEKFGMGADQEIDFDWGNAQGPSTEQVTSYYQAHHEKVSALYREVGDLLGIITGIGSEAAGEYERRFADAGREASLLALGTISNPELTIDYNLFGTEVTVQIEHSIPVPGVIKYLGVDNWGVLHTAAYSYSVNPSSFVRNVDLAVDLTAYVLDKLEIDYSAFVSNTKQVLEKIL